jgi:hypothetical protein
MQTPKMDTPVSKCAQASRHAQTMLRQFPSIATFIALADRLEASTAALLDRQRDYEAAVMTLVDLRVMVKYNDHVSDKGCRMAIRFAEMADGKPGGRIATHLFPEGVTPIVRPVGKAQVQSMLELEGRYDTVAGIFPDAQDEKQKITGLRQAYEQALEARRQGRLQATQRRGARDLAKEQFLDVFTEVASGVQAAFPRDRKMQDLFFDRIRARGDADDLEEGEDEADIEEAAPAAG